MTALTHHDTKSLCDPVLYSRPCLRGYTISTMAMTPEERKKEIERLRKIGRKGGRTTKKRHPDHFKKAGSKGGNKKWGK